MYYPFYDYYYNDYYFDQQMESAVMYMIYAFLILWCVLSIVFYIFEALAMYRIGKNRGMKYTALAFIPILNMYFLGRIADDISCTMNKKTSYAKRILLFTILSLSMLILGCIFFGMFTFLLAMKAPTSASLVFSFLFFFIYFVFMLISTVFSYISLYKIFKEYSPANATIFLVLSIVFSSTRPFLLFVIRNNKSGYQIWCEQQAAQQRMREAEQIDSQNG